jgi:hypothetical protein
MFAQKRTGSLLITQHLLEERIMNVGDLRRHCSHIQTGIALESKRPFLAKTTNNVRRESVLCAVSYRVPSALERR